MKLHVLHETVYSYTPPVKTAQHMSHLRPVDNDLQRLVSHSLVVDPAPARRRDWTDVYGNCRAFFSLQVAHERLKVVAESVVETAPAIAPPADTMPWEAVCERMRYHRMALYDPATEFMFNSPYVPRDARFSEYARASFTPGRPVLEAATDLMQRIHDEFEYVPHATDANTPALESLELRKGVCQDFAHVMLGCLRSLGLPARYVSGYLLTAPAPGQPRLVGSDASHAWVSLYLPEATGPGSWAELDPTNARAPGEDYVRLAIGRDYADVSPMRGVIHGGSNHVLRVGVTVTPVEDVEAEAAGEPERRT